MAALQRSTISFRRTGSSGLVWDEKFVSGLSEDGSIEYRELRHCQTVGAIGLMERKEPVAAPPSYPRILSKSECCEVNVCLLIASTMKIVLCHVGDKGIGYANE
ncbi:Protein of unknown function DUF4666 [Dillenia turbinata]|uniref:Uncharacterized protein n=1 Tax=Dillenia turbinata TaxID=194707 RepID=A0AAN8VHH9_9MAGN